MILDAAIENHRKMVNQMKVRTHTNKPHNASSHYHVSCVMCHVPCIMSHVSCLMSLVFMCQGVPGVVPERFEEAKQIRHCALSLVGEPIMYPHINEYVKLLHGKGISSFLVTNAQFPDRIRDMEPVTQL